MTCTTLTTAATEAILLMVLGVLPRVLLHFTIGSLSIARGIILLVVAVWTVLGPAAGKNHRKRRERPYAAGPVPAGRA